MSLPTQDSPQHQTIKSKLRKGGGVLGLAPPNKSPSLRPDLVGAQYGSVKVISPEIKWVGNRWNQKRQVHCQCVTCGRESWIALYNLQAGMTKGCRACNQPVRFPGWLYARLNGAQQRCTNPKYTRYADYGGRGIKFNFPSVSDACIWIRDNIGVPEQSREIHLDRIDNDGNYEAGNLRWSTHSQNASHTRKRPLAPLVHQFRAQYPEIRYADSTLRGLIGLGMTFDQIIARWNIPSCKPKGKYGTFSTADHFIASLPTGS